MNDQMNDRRWRGLLLIVLVACSAGRTVVSSSPPTTPSTTSSPTTTTIPTIELTVNGCSAPPVTFGVLCEVVELVKANHISPPDDASLVDATVAGIEEFPTEIPADVPRALTCAVPSESWAQVCTEVVERLQSDPVPVADLIEAGVVSMLTRTVDPYTQYVPPELVSAVGEDGIIPGVGMVVAALNAAGSPCVRVEAVCPLQVVTVIGGSPAEESGLLAGDVIEAIDGTSLQGLTIVEIAASLAGDVGSTAQLEVSRGEQTVQLTVTRAEAIAPPVTAEMVGNVGYLRLPEFGYDTHVVLHLVLASLIDSGASRLVLDLRDNPGGFLYSVSIIGSEFFSSGLLYRTMSPSGDLDYPAVEGGLATRIPMIVLVNGGSASAAEILAAVLQERDRAVIVGEPTYGKNLVQMPYELRNGGILRVSVATWTTPAGASVAGAGVLPDVSADISSQLPLAEVVAAAIAAAG